MTDAEEISPNDLVIAEVLKYAKDPLGYVLAVFPWGEAGTELEKAAGPRQWQREALEEIGAKLQSGAKDRGEIIQKAIASGHGIGKSAFVAWLIKWALDTHEDTRGVVTANTDTQLRTKTWPELAKWHRMSVTHGWFNHTATAMISTEPGHQLTWRVDAIPWSEINTEAFAGLHNQGKRVLMLFDEASGISDEVWDVAEGVATDIDTEIIWCVCGNPTQPKGRFFRCFNDLRHRWSPRSIDSRTVEGTNKVQLQKLVDDNGEDSDFVRIRVKGEFPRRGTNQFISAALVEMAQKRQPKRDTYYHSPRVLGVDVARHGDDSSVIIRRQGVKVDQPQRFHFDDLMQVAAEVAREIEEWKPDAIFIDATGMGWGVIDRLRQLKFKNIYSIQVGENAGDESRFHNLRAELWDRGREWLKEAGALPDDPFLVTDLTAQEYFYDVRNRTQMVSKEDMKSDGLASPDSADALLLTFAHSVGPRTTEDEPEWVKKLKLSRRSKRHKKAMAA